MTRGIKILSLTAILLLLASCAPSVISIDLGKEEETVQEIIPTKVPEPTPEPEPTPTVGFIDCETDLECFYESLGSCQESSLAYEQNLNMMGAEIETTLLLTVIGPQDDLCQFSVLTDQISITISEEAVQQLLAAGKTEDEIEAQRQMMEQSQESVRFDEICTGNPGDLIEVLGRWEQGQFSLNDWDPFSCEGKIFSSVVTIPDPTETSLPAEEIEPALGGNFLGNTSFEADPEAVQPGWYIDSKNTDLTAEWTTDQARDGMYSLMVSASESGNQGFPGWFLTDPIPVKDAVWHVVQVWAMTPDGADAFVMADFLDENGKIINGQSTGCVDLDPNTWNKLGFGILEGRLEEVSSIRLGLQQCLAEADGTFTHLYYDDVYIGTTPP